MGWIFIALLGPAFHGVANILDTYFTNRYFRRTSTLVFYSAAATVCFAPLVFLIARPSSPPLALVPAMLAIGAIELTYLYPYYRALQKDDTSVVVALFALGRLFVPLLAYFLVGETLGANQYLGFFILVAGSALLALNHKGKKIELNASFWFMLLTTSLLALEVVIYKYLFTNVDWGTGFVWPGIAEFMFALLLLFQPGIRRDVARHWHGMKRAFPLFGLEELLTFAGSAASTYAISLAPVTLVEGVGSLQPMFVLVYGLLLGRFIPRYAKEQTGGLVLFKKFLLFAVMLVGVWLVIKDGSG